MSLTTFGTLRPAGSRMLFFGLCRTVDWKKSDQSTRQAAQTKTQNCHSVKFFRTGWLEQFPMFYDQLTGVTLNMTNRMTLTQVVAGLSIFFETKVTT